MNCLVRGSILFAAAGLVWGCGTELDENADQLDHLTATPTVLLVTNTDSQTVDVEALNPQGQQLAASFELTNVGAGINVRRDTAFQPIAGGGTVPTRARYVVRATDPNTFVNTSFTVSAGGDQVTVPVRVYPAALAQSFSSSTPAPGDTVSLTAPPGVHFTSTTSVVAAGGSARILTISPDSTMLTVVFGVGINGVSPKVSNLVVDYLPGMDFDSIPTTGTITTGTIQTFPLVVSNLTPNYGDMVTVTIPGHFRATANSHVRAPGGATVINSISADSQTITFQAGPNANGILSVDSLVISGNPTLGRFTLQIDTTTRFMTPALPTVPGTINNTTPDVGDTVTFNVNAGFKIRPTATVTVGGTAAIITNVAADSSSISFLPAPGTSGPASINGVLIASLLNLPLTLPTVQTVAITGTTLYTGTDDPSTAPVFNVTNLAVGDTIEFYDVSVNIDQFYAIQVTGASATIAARLSWPGGSDVDILWCNAACTAFVGNFAGATGANPENSTVTFTTGINNFWVNLYAGASPDWVRIRFIRTS